MQTSKESKAVRHLLVAALDLPSPTKQQAVKALVNSAMQIGEWAMKPLLAAAIELDHLEHEERRQLREHLDKFHASANHWARLSTDT